MQRKLLPLKKVVCTSGRSAETFTNYSLTRVKVRREFISFFLVPQETGERIPVAISPIPTFLQVTQPKLIFISNVSHAFTWNWSYFIHYGSFSSLERNRKYFRSYRTDKQYSGIYCLLFLRFMNVAGNEFNPF